MPYDSCSPVHPDTASGGASPSTTIHIKGLSRRVPLLVTAVLMLASTFAPFSVGARGQASTTSPETERLTSIIESLMSLSQPSLGVIESGPVSSGPRSSDIATSRERHSYGPENSGPAGSRPTDAGPKGSGPKRSAATSGQVSSAPMLTVNRTSGMVERAAFAALDDPTIRVNDHSLHFARHDLSAGLRRVLLDSVQLDHLEIEDRTAARAPETIFLDPRGEAQRLEEEQRIDNEIARLVALHRALGLAQPALGSVTSPPGASDPFADGGAQAGRENETDVGRGTDGRGTDGRGAEAANSGIVAGRVLATEGSPVLGAEVLLSSDDGTFVAHELTDRAGFYRLTGLLQGSYRVSVRGPGPLDPPPGTAIAVLRGRITTHDVRGTTGASASGTVRDAATNLPLDHILVYAVGTNESYRGSAFTDSAGYYEITGLPDGDTWFHTNGSLDYVDEANGDVECIGGACAVSSVAAPITLDASQSGPVVDFSLDLGGAITTLITDEDTGAPLYPIYSELYRESFEQIRGIKRNEPDGNYRSYTVPAGQYFLQFFDTQDIYQREAYDDAPCGPWSCDLAGASPITVVAGQTTPITVALGRAASISGTVTDEVSGLPVASSVTLYDDEGNYYSGAIVRTTGTTAGQFRISGMEPGTYFLGTFNDQGFFGEIYDDIRMDLYSDVTTGQAIVVAEGAQIENVDFALTKGGAIRGSISEQTSGAPMPWTYLYISDLEGLTIPINARADSNGDFVLQPLEPGSYRVATRADYNDFINEIWEGLPCSQVECDYELATPLVITAAETIKDVDFALLHASKLRGRVTDAVTGSPVEGASVIANTGRFVFATSDADGSFEFAGLDAATYSVAVSHHEYQRQAYGGDYCRLYCNENSGDLVTVPSGTVVTAIDFPLERGGTVSGTITAETTGAPLGAVDLGLYNNSALLTELIVTALDGTYRFPGVPLNSGYYLSTMLTPEGYLRETWDDMPALFYPFREEVLELLYGRRIDWATGATEIANMALDDDTDAKTLSFEFAAGTGGGAAAVLFNQCVSNCELIGYPTGSVLTLWALPAPNSELDHWSGHPDCADGVITMTEDRTCVVHFRLKPDEVFNDGFESGDLTGWLP